MACDVAGPDKDELLAQHGGNPQGSEAGCRNPTSLRLPISHRRLNMVDYAARYSLRPARSSAAKSWSDRLMFTAATFSSRCATFEVPGIGNMTGLRLSTQASAIWPGVASWALAMPSRIEPGLARSPAEQRLDRAELFIARHLGVDAVQLPKADLLHPELFAALERFLQHAAIRMERFADELFGHVGPVGICGIDENRCQA